MASATLAASGVDFDSASPLNQALLGTFIFGMIQTHGMAQKLTPPQIHAIALCVFQDTLHYTIDAAAQGVQACINATDPNYHPTMNAILHRGVDGHKQYASVANDELSKNIRSVLELFANKI